VKDVLGRLALAVHPRATLVVGVVGMVLVIVYVVHVGILLVKAAELIGGLGNANVVVAVHVVLAIRSLKNT